MSDWHTTKDGVTLPKNFTKSFDHDTEIPISDMFDAYADIGFRFLNLTSKTWLAHPSTPKYEWCQDRSNTYLVTKLEANIDHPLFSNSIKGKILQSLPNTYYPIMTAQYNPTHQDKAGHRRPWLIFNEARIRKFYELHNFDGRLKLFNDLMDYLPRFTSTDEVSDEEHQQLITRMESLLSKDKVDWNHPILKQGVLREGDVHHYDELGNPVYVVNESFEFQQLKQAATYDGIWSPQLEKVYRNQTEPKTKSGYLFSDSSIRADPDDPKCLLIDKEEVEKRQVAWEAKHGKPKDNTDVNWIEYDAEEQARMFDY